MSVPPRRDLLFWTAPWLDHDITSVPVPPVIVGSFVAPNVWRRAFYPMLGPRVPGGLRYEASKA